MKKIAIVLALILSLAACHHDGLVPAMVDGQLTGCVTWAQEHGDAELEALCRSGRPLTEILDLFAARQQAMQRDAGADR